MCIRVPHEDKPGARSQEVRTYATTTPALLDLRDWLVCQGVTLVVMEASSAYRKPPFYLLEDDITCQVVNARDVKNVPGRPKTDKLNAVWLCKLAERGMLRPGFIPDRPHPSALNRAFPLGPQRLHAPVIRALRRRQVQIAARIRRQAHAMPHARLLKGIPVGQVAGQPVDLPDVTIST